MGVDLRRADVGVAEHGLDRAQIGPPLDQVGGKRVAQLVRRQALADAGGARVGGEQLPEALAGHGAAPVGHEQRRRAARAEQRRAGRGQVLRMRSRALSPSGTRRCFLPLPMVDKKRSGRLTSR